MTELPDMTVVMGLALALCVAMGAVAVFAWRQRSARRAAEAELARARASLLEAAKLSSLGEMVAGIAHEINNPLSIIEGRGRQLQRLLRATPIDREATRRLADNIVETSLRIERIVKGLSAFARDAALDPPVETPLATILDGTTALCHERLRALGVRLVVDPVPPGLILPCRETQLSQVLLNLLANAADAAALGQEKWIRVSAREAAGVVEIAVTDSGPGVPPQVVPRLFQPFVTTKPAGRGTGLGLSISRSLIEQHGGTLDLDAHAPRTRFVIKLPRTPGTGFAKAG